MGSAAASHHHHLPDMSALITDFLGDPHIAGPLMDFITLASTNANGHLTHSINELFRHASDKCYDIMCVTETGARYHEHVRRIDAIHRRKYSSYAMPSPSETNTTGGISFCVSSRMTPLVNKLVSFPTDRFCALHLAGKRGTPGVCWHPRTPKPSAHGYQTESGRDAVEGS